MRGLLLVVLSLLIISGLILPQSVLASHGRVLGAKSENTRVDLVTTQGPGLLLPSSPLYFIDLWRDNLMLFLSSFDKEAQAKLHLKIAGERIAEVKMMLEAKAVSTRGLDIALANITENINGAASSLKAQKNKGKNVEKLSSELNEILGAQKESLRIIARAYDDKISFKIKASVRAIEEEEVKIEDEMVADLLDSELKKELEIAYDEAVKETDAISQKVIYLEKELNRQTSPATPAGSVAGASASGNSGGSDNSGSGQSEKD